MTPPINLSSEWINHIPERAKAVSNHEPDCACGTVMRHRHCGCCGRIISKGDWEAACSQFNFKTRRFERRTR